MLNQLHLEVRRKMLGATFIIVFGLVAAEETSSFLTDSKTRSDLLTQTLLSTHVNSNAPFVEKDENLVRMPIITSHNEAHRLKKKQKKPPKRTIQKIIKKNKMKSKMRKIYYSQRTNKPTTKIDYDKFYGSEDQNYERTTAQTQNQRKRARKYNNKVTRYHLPFQNSQMKNNHRHKRDWSRELYVLKNFDEAKFIKRGEDYDLIKTDVERPW